VLLEGALTFIRRLNGLLLSGGLLRGRGCRRSALLCGSCKYGRRCQNKDSE
jgi:hypothetical protein